MRTLALTAVAVLVGACASPPQAPLLFGQAQTLGISVGANAANQTPEMTLGYKDVNIAVIPTVNPGTGGLIQGRSSDGFDDSYSTFGQFEANGGATGVSLGKFFATGIAARRLADGFACEISDASDVGCPNQPVPIVR